jgi:hypothetical protein
VTAHAGLTGTRTMTAPGRRGEAAVGSLGMGRSIAATAEATPILPPHAPRVAGYLRFVFGSPFPIREDVLRATAAERGYHLVTVVHSTDVSTLTRGCPGIVQIMHLIDQHQIDGVLTLADYTLAWDVEVVGRISARIRDRAAFLDYVWPTRLPTPHIDPNRTYR